MSKPKLGDTIATYIFRALIGAIGCIAVYFSIERAYDLDAAAILFAMFALFAAYYALGFESKFHIRSTGPDVQLFLFKLVALIAIGTLGWVHFQYELGAETFSILALVMAMASISQVQHTEIVELRKRLDEASGA